MNACVLVPRASVPAERRGRAPGPIPRKRPGTLRSRAFAFAGGGTGPYQPSTLAKISGATMVASDSMTKRGVSMASLPQEIFSLGTAPE